MKGIRRPDEYSVGQKITSLQRRQGR